MDQTSRQQAAQKGQLEISHLAEKSGPQQRPGGRDPEKFFTDFTKEKGQRRRRGERTDHYAWRAQMRKGVTSAPAGLEVSAAKVAGAFRHAPRPSGRATEQLEAGIKSTRLAVKHPVARAARSPIPMSRSPAARSAPTPAQQLETIKRRSPGQKTARTKLNNYEDQKDYYPGGRGESSLKSCSSRLRRSRISTRC